MSSLRPSVAMGCHRSRRIGTCGPATEVWISTSVGTAKIRNLRRDPRIVLCIDDPASGDYVQIVGTATIIEGPAVREPTIELIRKYRAEPEVVPHWERISSEAECVIIAVRPERFQWHDR